MNGCYARLSFTPAAGIGGLPTRLPEGLRGSAGACYGRRMTDNQKQAVEAIESALWSVLGERSGLAASADDIDQVVEVVMAALYPPRKLQIMTPQLHYLILTGVAERAAALAKSIEFPEIAVAEGNAWFCTDPRLIHGQQTCLYVSLFDVENYAFGTVERPSPRELPENQVISEAVQVGPERGQSICQGLIGALVRVGPRGRDGAPLPDRVCRRLGVAEDVDFVPRGTHPAIPCDSWLLKFKHGFPAKVGDAVMPDQKNYTFREFDELTIEAPAQLAK